MTGPIDINRSQKPFVGQPQDEVNSRQQRERTRAGGDDRVSLGEDTGVGQTYGPGLKVASPYELLRNLVVKTLQEQGLELNFTTDAGEVIDFNTMTPEEAQDLISEDGYFGVEKTSQRIVDFAINAFGGDPEKLQQMKDAIDQGFTEAQEAFGGALPEISQHTYDAIMEKLDAFAAQFDEAGD
jgi:hypothetical protein